MVLSKLFLFFLFPEGDVERENQIQDHQRWMEMVLCESPGRMAQRPVPRGEWDDGSA
jgi:hypothetical protein